MFFLHMLHSCKMAVVSGFVCNVQVAFSLLFLLPLFSSALVFLVFSAKCAPVVTAFLHLVLSVASDSHVSGAMFSCFSDTLRLSLNRFF